MLSVLLQTITIPEAQGASEAALSLTIILCSFVGLIFAAIYAHHTSQIKLTGDDELESPMLVQHDDMENPHGSKSVLEKVRQISQAISEGANAFLKRMYTYMGIFMVAFSVVIIVLIGHKGGHYAVDAAFTALAFCVGCCTSILSGWIGMKIAVYANSRTALEAQKGYGPAFVTSFKAGCVMGFTLVANGVLILYTLVRLYAKYYSYQDVEISEEGIMSDNCQRMFEAIAGYGLGGSSIALFGRVGGGIYTKAADVGADLCGKLEFDIPEDDPRNPAVIADNVGDNVGDVAGMGADLFGSFAESTCAAMVITSQVAIDDPTKVFLPNSMSALCFPMTIPAAGIIVCIITSFVATHLIVVQDKAGIEPSLKRQLLVSTFLMTPTIFLLCWGFLPHDTFQISTSSNVTYWKVFFCIASGLWAGLAIGYITEYYTSNAYQPVQDVSQSCTTGAATNIIYGLALGYRSVIIPILALALVVFIGLQLAGMYGIAMGALGILSTMSIGLTIDAYGPICDNAGGIAEMSGMGEEIRQRTDALDAAGNTTAAIGKGFAIGSAALVSLALFGGFVTITRIDSVNILGSFEFAGLLVGAMLPYWFSALTMKAVGAAALEMVEEVRRQFKEHPNIMEGTEDPDYGQCVDISTKASLGKMIAPGALVMLSPLVVGYLVGVESLAGLLAGALVSGVQMAISASNTGGAWDNAKKYIEAGNFEGKGSEPHKAAVIGDTVGDPLKDTSGPSLNILVKLMAIISLVFARSFASQKTEGLLVQLAHV